MLSGEGNENGKKNKNNKNRSNQQKRNFARATHFLCTFLCRCFIARLKCEISRSFLVTRFMEEMSYVFLFLYAIFPPSLIFTQVAASISHFLTAATKFHVVPPTKSVRCLLRKKTKQKQKQKKKQHLIYETTIYRYSKRHTDTKKSIDIRI